MNNCRTGCANILVLRRLEDLGLVSAPEAVKSPAMGQALPTTRRARGRWPSYQYCLDRAPVAHGDDRPDISRADFTWCMTALDWGWSVEDVARQLIEESTKAQEEGANYASLTATRAAQAVERRRGREPVP